MNLGIFNDINLYSASADLFQQLCIKVNSNTSEPLPIEGLLKQHLKETEIFKSINQTFFIGIIDDSVFQQMSLFKGDYSYTDALQQADKSYDGLMFFALELAKHPTRTEISELTRAFNRISQKMPVALILKYKFEKETALSITISERFKYKQNWRQGEKAGKVIILRDVKTINTHAGHQRILLDLVKPVGVSNYAQLHEHWLQVLDVSVLNKQFYQKLFNWYLWALTKAEFPQIRPEEDKIKNDVHQSESLIRLLSRLLFCWFMKEKGLINPNLFNIDYLRKTLKGFEGIKSEETIYYKAILQNLFFATLNKPIDERKIIDKGFNKKEYGDPLVYRYEELFKDDKNVLSHFENIPFLNGGLFDCLDQKKDKDNPVEIRLDGFSTKKDKQPVLPDMFFFGEYDGIDLSEEYDDKKKSKVKVFGLLDILHQYKFTIEENTPLEEEIALDPELLGKVFENLLASYNPETKTTARKQTGSFYTPREIVNYMVEESLLCYFKNTVDDEERLRNLFSYNETVNPFDKKETRQLIEAINTAKIIDPACGSGAFPMGILQKLIHVLHKLDPENKIWFELVIANFPTAMQNVARQRLEKENWNFVRKLGIIQECIYGVDKQPIAIQISKLRFFISLLVDQTDRPNEPNRGFEPLPNLDFKLIAANTLIAAPESDTVSTGLFTGQIDPFFQEFDLLTNEYFNVHLPKNKKDKKREILKLIDKKIAEKRKQLNRAIDVKNKKQTDAGLTEIKLWNSYANLFKNEAVGFYETKYFFPKAIEGFDIIIGNPPYVSALELKKLMPQSEYDYLKKKFITAKGAVDLYIYFFEKGLQILKKGGFLAYISPNRYLSASYGEALREYIFKNASIHSIIDYSDIKVFEEASTYPILSFLIKESKNDYNISIGKFNKATEELNFKIESSQKLDFIEGYIWGFLLNEKIAITEKVIVQSIRLKDVCKINATSTASEADEYHELINENDGYPLINTGTIDRYTTSWGKELMTDKGKKFLHPYLPKESHIISDNRHKLYSSEKIIFAKIAIKTEAFYDEKGKYASVNTNCLHSFSKDISPKYILAWVNSKLFQYTFECFFDGLKMQGGYLLYSAPNLSSMFIKEINTDIQNKIIPIVEYISIGEYQNILFFDRLIDAIMYEIYLPDEISDAGCQVIEFLTTLPRLKQEWSTEQKVRTIEKVYKELSGPSHPVSAALLKLLNVEAIKSIEG